MDEIVETCKTIYSHKPTIDCNYSQMKRLQCINRPKMYQTHHKLSIPWVKRHRPHSGRFQII